MSGIRFVVVLHDVLLGLGLERFVSPSKEVTFRSDLQAHDLVQDLV